jgi:hypothetical protein
VIIVPDQVNCTRRVKEFLPYVEKIEHMAVEFADTRKDRLERLAALDGAASAALRRAIPLERLRKNGAFFTQSGLATVAMRHLPTCLPNLFFDPACGAGDLLLAVARRLPLQDSLSATLRSWGSRLSGRDRHQEFVRAAKARLVLLAIERMKIRKAPSDRLPGHLFPLISEGEGLEARSAYQKSDCIILNPPFYASAAPAGCNWAAGNVTSAAVFIEEALKLSRRGTRVIAILPEVLRTGSRYAKWRKHVGEGCSIQALRTCGVFAASVDIDVFIFAAVKGKSSRRRVTNIWHRAEGNAESTLGETFDVHVGAVVPHRHRKRGPESPYIHARSLPRWEEVSSPQEVRRFSGTLFTPPFVAVRRTSRAEDEHRAVATLIASGAPVAVENHVLVCRPKNGSIHRCRKLLQCLKSTKVNAFLNERIRCRHLTVSAVRELPLPKH